VVSSLHLAVCACVRNAAAGIKIVQILLELTESKLDDFCLRRSSDAIALTLSLASASDSVQHRGYIAGMGSRHTRHCLEHYVCNNVCM